MTEHVNHPDNTGLTVVIPCYNEADNIKHSYQEIVESLGDFHLELLYVDDGSTDESLDVIRELAASDPRVQYLSFTRNFGFEAAFSAGYRYASKPWLLHVDADQQFPAAEAHKLIGAAEAGYDAVFGVRTNRQDPLLRRWGTAAFHFIARRLLRIELPKGATAFRLVRTELAQRIVELEQGTPYFLATVPRLTSRYTTVPVAHRARARGESKVGMSFLSSHAIELFVGYSGRLSTAASAACLVASGLAVALAVGTLADIVSGTALSVALLLLLAVGLVTSSLAVRSLVVVGAGQPRPRLFYVREASIAVADADRLLCTTPTLETV